MTKSQRRGFAMAELLVATVCLAVTALGILSALQFSDNQNTLARQRLIALSFANSEIEKYVSKAYYGGIVATSSSVSLPGSGLPQPATLTTTVTATADPKVFNVTAQVAWTVTIASGNTTRTIRLDTALRNSDAP